MKRGSQKMQLAPSDWQKIGKSFALGLAGVVAGYLAQFAAEHDFGSLTPLVAGIVPVLVNAFLQWLRDTRETSL